MPFLDDVPIKGCAVDEKNEEHGYREFVVSHIVDCEKILVRLEEVHLTLSSQKYVFGVEEVLIVDHMCRPYGRKPSLVKVDGIDRM